ncbi:hypothetical protein HDU98_007893 [Podochytrium sp. JEL0797]|nr:hypothetical protein HDU98_007893 [Podochytrium sp. JEL0797]
MSDVLHELARKVKGMQDKTNAKRTAASTTTTAAFLARSQIRLDLAHADDPRLDTISQIDDNADIVANIQDVVPPWESTESTSESMHLPTPDSVMMGTSTPEKKQPKLPFGLSLTNNENIAVALPSSPMTLVKEIPSIRLRRTLIPRTPGGTPLERAMRRK